MSDLVGNPEDRFSCVTAHFEAWGLVESILGAGIAQSVACLVSD